MDKRTQVERIIEADTIDTLNAHYGQPTPDRGEFAQYLLSGVSMSFQEWVAAGKPERKKTLLEMVRKATRSQWCENVTIWESGSKRATLVHRPGRGQVDLQVTGCTPLTVYILDPMQGCWREVHDLDKQYQAWVKKNRGEK